jgi:tRNA(fMet)-specific endonuclease VapC
MGVRGSCASSIAHGRGAVLTSLLLDTSVLIDVERDGFDLDDLIGDDDEPAIAAITVAELGVGVEIASGKRKSARKLFLDDVIATLPIVGYDIEVARAHTGLLVAVRKRGTPRGAHDLIIAATARATARTVVTSDRTGFLDLPGVVVRHPA